MSECTHDCSTCSANCPSAGQQAPEGCTHDCSTCSANCPSAQQVPEGCTHDCSSCSANCPSRQMDLSQFRKPLNPLSVVRKVIGVVSGKGGVGKSMVTSLLAVEMGRLGYKTAILDADITGPSIPKAFGLNGIRAEGDQLGIYPVPSKLGTQIMSVNLLLPDETDPVVWRGPVIAGQVEQFWSEVIWKDVDFMFIDMPPGTGDVPLTVFQSIPIDGIVIVTSPQQLVSMVVTKAIKMAQLMNVPILGVVENMSYLQCPDCGKRLSVFGESGLDKVADKLGVKVLGKLPIDPALARNVDDGQIELYEGDYMGDIVAAVEALL